MDETTERRCAAPEGEASGEESRRAEAEVAASLPSDGVHYFLAGVRRLADQYGPQYVTLNPDVVPDMSKSDADHVLQNLERDIQDEIETEKRRNEDG